MENIDERPNFNGNLAIAAFKEVVQVGKKASARPLIPLSSQRTNPEALTGKHMSAEQKEMGILERRKALMR